MNRLTGNEQFLSNGTGTEFTVSDFWNWAYSDLLNNTSRGVLAEYLVATAVGTAEDVRRDWFPYDVLTRKGRRIEVKCSAYLQSWDEDYHEHILFDIAPKLPWTPEGGYGAERRRNSDLYVFCLYTALTKDRSILDLDLWEFYVLPTSVLNDRVPEQKTIGLSSLAKLNPVKCTFASLAEAIEGAEL